MTGRDLETRYRRLLAVYPWEHRRRYEDEMLGVLLDDARPGQRHPGIGDTANLVVAGLRARLGWTAHGLTDRAWPDAAAVTGLLAALTLLTMNGHALISNLAPTLGQRYYPYGGDGVDAIDWLPVGTWAAVSLALLVGLRRPAIVLVWAALLTEVALVPSQYDTDPVPAVSALWQIPLALVAAVAVTVRAPRRRALVVLGIRRLLTIVLALATIDAVFLINRLASDNIGANGATFYVFHLHDNKVPRPNLELASGSDAQVMFYLAFLAAAVLALLVTVATMDGPVRRRIAVLLAPVVALVVLVEQTLDGWAVSNMNMGHPIYLVPAQWLALATVPLLTLLIALLLLRRREHTLRMVALGRTADREHPTP
ncbi:hypothetical protein [Micromonospora sp. NBC_01796]|uniref:hypothetical protein n=1 Tax=Micromonospora sp. NBC_01796 TaxID=2975987 RepID=UPI002DDA2505|nr:hypothetical protein [Micromonospora sp. NBC_01796]WSA83212.1 hypothetical protein OIE47_22680 [Micromonospora sp. NBC_01796]